MAGDKKPLNRPKKRTLVRWDDNLNELLLLTIQSVCNTQGIRIPWGDVAETMGNNVSEGAIVQHLAKVRTRRVEKNKDVPPPLRRGGTATTKASITPSAAKPSAETAPSKPKSQPKGKGRKLSENSTKEDSPPMNDSDDDEYGKRHREKKSRNNSNKKRKFGSDSEDMALNDGNDDGEPHYNSDESMVAMDAPFLKFPNDDKYSSRGTSPFKDDVVPQRPSKMVTLQMPIRNSVEPSSSGSRPIENQKPGEIAGGKAAGEETYLPRRQFDRKGKEWIMPPPGADDVDWGLSEHYYGPIPLALDDPTKPTSLIAGEWPRDVVLRQYEMPDPKIWEPERENQGRTVIPGAWLRDEDCPPQLLFHRKLHWYEREYAEERKEAKKREDYQHYVDTHQELPTFFDPSYNYPPTLHMTSETDDYKVQDQASNQMLPLSEAFRERHAPGNTSKLRPPQLAAEMYTPNMIDTNNLVTPSGMHTIDLNKKYAPGRVYKLDEEVGDTRVEQVVRDYDDWLS